MIFSRGDPGLSPADHPEHQGAPGLHPGHGLPAPYRRGQGHPLRARMRRPLVDPQDQLLHVILSRHILLRPVTQDIRPLPPVAAQQL